MSHAHDHEPHGLSAAGQAYLLTARSMVGAGQPITISGLASRMQVSKQATSEMAGRLVREGYLEPANERELTLTNSGREQADAVFRRHALLEWLLTKVIGLSWADWTKRPCDSRSQSRHASKRPSANSWAIRRRVHTATRSTSIRSEPAAGRLALGCRAGLGGDDLPDHRGGRGGRRAAHLPRVTAARAGYGCARR